MSSSAFFIEAAGETPVMVLSCEARGRMGRHRQKKRDEGGKKISAYDN